MISQTEILFRIIGKKTVRPMALTGVLQIAAYGFLAIISLITVLNIKNSISMGVSARVKQYGAMCAVGMENRQVTIAVGIVRLLTDCTVRRLENDGCL